MGIMNLASHKSLWRGYEYYTQRRATQHIPGEKNQYDGKVLGSGKTYTVHLDIEHPRKSTCTCPHAAGKRIICKHMAAMYFDIFPKEADEYYREVEENEREEERRQEEEERMLASVINSMKKEELKDALWWILSECPEWLYERFVYEMQYR